MSLSYPPHLSLEFWQTLREADDLARTLEYENMRRSMEATIERLQNPALPHTDPSDVVAPKPNLKLDLHLATSLMGFHPYDARSTSPMSSQSEDCRFTWQSEDCRFTWPYCYQYEPWGNRPIVFFKEDPRGRCFSPTSDPYSAYVMERLIEYRGLKNAYALSLDVPLLAPAPSGGYLQEDYDSLKSRTKAALTLAPLSKRPTKR